MLYIVHHMTTDFLVSIDSCTIGSFVNKCIIFQQLPRLRGFCFFQISFQFFLTRSVACQNVQGTRDPKFQNGACLNVLVLDWFINHSTLVKLLVIHRNHFHPSVSRRPCCLEYCAQVTGSSLAIKSRG
jgi:hypothetical protein